jgi:hypothetical protein
MVTTAEYLGMEYISKYWVRDNSGTSKSSFTVDTDTCVFPDRLMVLGLKLKYMRAKGFDVGSMAEPGSLVYEYEGELSRAKVADKGAKTLSMNPRLTEVLISAQNIPDSGFGS